MPSLSCYSTIYKCLTITNTRNEHFLPVLLSCISIIIKSHTSSLIEINSSNNSPKLFNLL